MALPKFSLAAQKIWVAQKLGGGGRGVAAAPLARPARTPMVKWVTGFVSMWITVRVGLPDTQ